MEIIWQGGVGGVGGAGKTAEIDSDPDETETGPQPVSPPTAQVARCRRAGLESPAEEIVAIGWNRTAGALTLAWGGGLLHRATVGHCRFMQAGDASVYGVRM